MTRLFFETSGASVSVIMPLRELGPLRRWSYRDPRVCHLWHLDLGPRGQVRAMYTPHDHLELFTLIASSSSNFAGKAARM
jgi:hypothetical protein